jgi:hypothetical protein
MSFCACSDPEEDDDYDAEAYAEDLKGQGDYWFVDDDISYTARGNKRIRGCTGKTRESIWIETFNATKKNPPEIGTTRDEVSYLSDVDILASSRTQASDSKEEVSTEDTTMGYRQSEYKEMLDRSLQNSGGNRSIIRERQQACPKLRSVIKYLSSGRRHKNAARARTMDWESKSMYIDDNGILRRFQARTESKESQDETLLEDVEERSTIQETIQERQRACPELRSIIRYIEEGILPDNAVRAQKIIRESKYMFLDEDGILIRSRQHKDRMFQRIIPLAMTDELTNSYHINLGHTGFGLTYSSLRQLYDWIGMRRTVMKVVSRCDICQQRKRHSGNTQNGKIVAESCSCCGSAGSHRVNCFATKGRYLVGWPWDM